MLGRRKPECDYDVIVAGDGAGEPGDMEQGYRVDECIEIAELEAGQQFMGENIDAARA